jgi:hypothetical protein
MQDVTQLQQSAIDRVRLLSTERLVQVIDFIDFLLERTEPFRISDPDAPQGSVDDLLAVAGIWQFEPGELHELLQDIEQSRLMELEERNDSLLD